MIAVRCGVGVEDKIRSTEVRSTTDGTQRNLGAVRTRSGLAWGDDKHRRKFQTEHWIQCHPRTAIGHIDVDRERHLWGTDNLRSRDANREVDLSRAEH